MLQKLHPPENYNQPVLLVPNITVNQTLPPIGSGTDFIVRNGLVLLYCCVIEVEGSSSRLQFIQPEIYPYSVDEVRLLHCWWLILARRLSDSLAC